MQILVIETLDFLVTEIQRTKFFNIFLIAKCYIPNINFCNNNKNNILVIVYLYCTKYTIYAYFCTIWQQLDHILPPKKEKL